MSKIVESELHLLVRKVIEKRRFLIRTGKNRKPTAEMWQTMHSLEKWINTYRPSYEQLKGYLKRHYHDFERLIPNNHKAWKEELESLID